jgi:tetratricopeptide (TPR) repeat protein
VALAELMLSHDPLLEDIHRRLMELYARLGRYSSALKQYRICQSILASELSEAPEPATTQLYERIRDQRAASERSLPAIGSAQRAGSPGMPLSGTAKGEASRQASATEAAELYQMGRSYFLRNIWGKRALEAARQLFLQAIEIDRGFARAYAGLADCDCYGVLLGMPGASNDAIADNSLRALELDPNLPEALAARGLALYVMNQHTEANAYFERAVRLGPELFEAHYFYARNCRVLGQHERAAVLFERAATLNKNDYRALGLLSDEYRAIGRLATA